MFIQFNFYRAPSTPVAGHLEYWVQIELENDEVILDWISIGEDHPIFQLLASVGGVEKGSYIGYGTDFDFNQILDLEVFQLIFSSWECDNGYF